MSGADYERDSAAQQAAMRPLMRFRECPHPAFFIRRKCNEGHRGVPIMGAGIFGHWGILVLIVPIAAIVWAAVQSRKNKGK